MEQVAHPTDTSEKDNLVVDSNVMPDARSMKRRSKTISLAAIPVLLDGSPGDLRWANAKTEDISATGAGIIFETELTLPGRTIVIGVDVNGGAREFITMEVVSQQVKNGRLRVGGKWAIGTPEDVFLSERLRPHVDPKTLTFVYGWSEETLKSWARLGVLRPYLVDRVLVCARCQSIPSWRNGCHACGSGRMHRDRLVHHFACAHVGRTNEFETANGLRCPKCRASNLIVGSDYEYIDGPVECHDCGANGGQPAMAAMCHRCHHRFRPEEAEEHMLHGYYVQRLDPLVLYAS